MLNDSGRYRHGKLTDTPSCGVEVLAGRSNGERQVLNLRRQCRNSREGRIVEPVVDLIRENDDFILDTEVPYALKLILGEYLADRVVCMS